jgi:TonB family protein
MLYAVAVSGASTVAALWAERALGSVGPRRVVWAAALAFSVALPTATWIRAGSATAAGVALGEPEVVVGTPGADAAAVGRERWARVETALRRLDPAVARGWAMASGGLLAVFLVSSLRLRRRARRWRAGRVAGEAVRVSHDEGPAVVGLLRPCIVLPSWLMDLGPEERRLIVRHEREHLRARDPWVVFAGFAVVTAFPWSPGAWIQLARLRSAVEVDCDRRVMRGRPWTERRRYGELLVAVAERVAAGAHRPALAAFAERTTSLERRIRAMLGLTSRPSPLRLAVWLGGASLLVGAACLVPGPDREDPTGPGATTEAPAAPDLSAGPVFTPYTIGPEIVNRDEIVQALRDGYPPLLREAGIGGTVKVWFLIDTDGRVVDVRVSESSGEEPLDAAALRVASAMRFTPATNRDQPVSVWVTFPITFQADADVAAR